jgi:cell cycle arrest protein BUB2
MEDESLRNPSPGTEIPLRARVWKCLLRIPRLDSEPYIAAVRAGPLQEVYSKIANDLERTFKNDRKFKERVSSQKLNRVINTLVRTGQSSILDPSSFSTSSSSASGSSSSSSSSISGPSGAAVVGIGPSGTSTTADDPSSPSLPLRVGHYVQGMNVVVGTFLYVMPELDAFYALSRLLNHLTPTYFQKNCEGARAACVIMEKVLQHVDPKLLEHLHRKNALAVIYAFGPMLVFSLDFKPLDSALQLLDFYVAYGFHMNVLTYVARLLVAREELMDDSKRSINVKEILEHKMFDPLLLSKTAMQMLAALPEDLVEQLWRHPWDWSVCKPLYDQCDRTIGKS